MIGLALNAGMLAETGIGTLRTLLARLTMSGPGGQSGPRGCAARCLSDLTGGDKNMRYALVIAMLLGSTLLAQAEPIDRDKWIAQTGKASKSCLAKFRQKFGEDKGHNYSRCVTDQTNKAIDDCVGSSGFSNCVLEKSLRVLEVCDLSSC
jgi:hypothetical protein